MGVTRGRDTALTGQYEIPFGFGGAPTYFGMITTRHMHEYGTTLEQWAQVAVSTRRGPALNPKARNREPITVADVLASRPVCYPFNLLNICLVTDAGGAVVLTRADRAKDCAKKPVYVRGAGEATEHVMRDPDAQPHAQRGHAPVRREGVRDGRRQPRRTSTTSCSTTPSPRGRRSCSSRWASASPARACTSSRTAAPTPGGTLPINTNGGGLSYTHTRHVRHLPDHRGRAAAARRVRRRARCPACKLSLVNGMGGMLSAAGTLVLSHER